MSHRSIHAPGSGIKFTPPSRCRQRFLWLAILAIPLLLLTACSGSNSNSSSGATGSTWDQMNWDQGKWG